MTGIPPPRYRIVERKGRIVVTDTWAEKGRPAMPPVPAPGAAPRRHEPGGGLERLRDRLVALACLGASDDAGRPILTTHHHVDEKGPRSIVLDEAGAARLGNWLLGLAAVAIGSLVAMAFVPLAAILTLGAAGLALTSANTTARPAITRWLDTLGDGGRR